MNYQVVFDPNLKVSAGSFATDWNAEPRCQAVAVAQANTEVAKGFDPLLAEVINLVVIPLAMGLASNALYDLIKDILLKEGVRRQTRVIYEKQADGTERLIVTIDEEF